LNAYIKLYSSNNWHNILKGESIVDGTTLIQVLNREGKLENTFEYISGGVVWRFWDVLGGSKQ
jgi:hypothetical protein